MFGHQRVTWMLRRAIVPQQSALCFCYPNKLMLRYCSGTENIAKSGQPPRTVHTIIGYIRSKKEINIDEEKAVTVVNYLIQQSIPPDHIAKSFQHSPELFDFSLTQWQSAVQTLIDYGFKTSRVMPVLYNHDALFHGKCEKLYEVGESLRHIGFHDGDIQRILCQNPQLFIKSSADIVAQYNKLLKTFKKIEIVQLALESPNILSDDFSTINRKVRYISHKMGITHGSIVKHNALSFPLQRIKSRHLFLERAGLYELPDPNSTLKSENATLKQIVQFDDKRFAKKVAGMSLEELHTFEKMIDLEDEEEIELSQQIESGDLSDSDDEEEEEDN